MFEQWKCDIIYLNYEIEEYIVIIKKRNMSIRMESINLI